MRGKTIKLETQHPTPRRRYGNEEQVNKFERLVSLKETRKILGVSDATVRRLIKQGTLVAVHLSARCVRITEGSLRKLTGQVA